VNDGIGGIGHDKRGRLKPQVLNDQHIGVGMAVDLKSAFLIGDAANSGRLPIDTGPRKGNIGSVFLGIDNTPDRGL